MPKIAIYSQIKLRHVFLVYFMVVCVAIVVLRQRNDDYAEKYLKVEYYIILALLMYILFVIYNRKIKRIR